MGIARRSVLRGVAAAALLPLTTVVAAAAAPGSHLRNSVDVGAVTRLALEAAVGSAVRMVGDSGTATGTLHHVNDLRHASAGHPQAFAAVFHLDDDGAALEQGLVAVELPGLRLTGAGLLVTAGSRTAVLHVDRRSVAEHLSSTRRT